MVLSAQVSSRGVWPAHRTLAGFRQTAKPDTADIQKQEFRVEGLGHIHSRSQHKVMLPGAWGIQKVTVLGITTRTVGHFKMSVLECNSQPSGPRAQTCFVRASSP